MLHKFEALSEGGLIGLRGGQRDWSPYVAHFTSWKAMAPLRNLHDAGLTIGEISQRIRVADTDSFEIAKSIAKSGRIIAMPAQRNDVPKRVCLTECSLPGLLSHSERYGRFGFVFNRDELYAMGGRPCLYVDDSTYGFFAKSATELEGNASHARDMKQLLGLANVYTPVRQGKVQDYTHEREWRIFKDIELTGIRPVALLAPTTDYCKKIQLIFDLEVPCYSLQQLYRWGA